jgi:hypothetical protein
MHWPAQPPCAIGRWESMASVLTPELRGETCDCFPDVAAARYPAVSTKPPSGERSAGSEPTLGELLCAGQGQTSAPESDWVALVKAVAAQDHAALRALYERTHHIVFTLIVRITGERRTAEELTLDVFEHVWRQASNYDPETGTVLAWIMNHARCHATDRLQFEHVDGDTPRPPRRTARSRIRAELAKLRRALGAGAREP